MRQTREKIQEIADKAAALRSVGYVNAMNVALGLPHGSVREAWMTGELKECPECAGNGYVPVRDSSTVDVCPSCNGERWVR